MNDILIVIMVMISDVLITVGSIVFVYMTAWFLLAIISKRNDIADTAWGIGFIVAAISALALNPNPSIVSYVVVLLTTIWGLRLAIHIATRNKGKHEDFRYAQWRKDWGKLFLVRSFLQVFILQGVLLVLVSLPVTLSAGIQNTLSVSAWFAAGVLLWTVGFLFEAIGDYQLRLFLSSRKEKGSVMQTGLWQYTRHPNYFGEVTQWWGLWLICASSSLPLGTKLFALIGPATITVLILFVSGIPLLEKKYEKDEKYQEYARRTNIFFPGNPRKVAK